MASASPASVWTALSARRSLPLLDVAGVERYLARLLKEDKEELFHRPVRVTSDIGDYLQRIAEPMDLSTIRSRFRAGRYATYGQLLDDVERVSSNCLEYNGDDHEYAPLARAMRDRGRALLLQAIEAWESRDAFAGAAARLCKALLSSLTHHRYGGPFTIRLQDSDIWDDYRAKSAASR